MTWKSDSENQLDSRDRGDSDKSATLNKPPADHYFFHVRSTVEWFFKLIGWLALCTTIRYGWHATGSAVLSILYGISILFLTAFLQSYCDWIIGGWISSSKRWPFTPSRAISMVASVVVSVGITLLLVMIVNLVSDALLAARPV